MRFCSTNFFNFFNFLKKNQSINRLDRPIEFEPARGTPYDPRHLLAGVQQGDRWLSGFFDKDSFVETLAGWAKVKHILDFF